MAYSGPYIPKNRSKYKGDVSAIRYRSHWEKMCFMWCDKEPSVKYWSSEEVVVPYFWDIDKRYHRYFVDLKITFTNGKTILVEIKPAKETEPPKKPNKSKWEAANSFAKDRGWTFEIWTEHTLKSMGIMKEQKGKLKPLKPLKPYR